MSRKTFVILACLLSLSLTGCASSGPKGAAAFSSITASHAGNYQVRLAGPTEVTAGEAFDLEVQVTAPPGRELGSVSVKLDGEHPGTRARLPEDLSATMMGDGHYRFLAMSLSEPGVWNIFVDVTRGALTERAQVQVKINPQATR